MSNPDTPTGGNGKKELKVTRTKEADDLLDKYFEDLKKEGYGKIQIRALTFDVPEVALKSKGGEDKEEHVGLSDVINVLTSAQRTIELEEIANGVKASARLADLEKVKMKTKQIKEKKLETKQKEKTNPASGTEKPSENRDR